MTLITKEERRKASKKKYKDKNKPIMEQQRRDNYARYIFMSLRTRARRLNIEFNLEESDIVIPDVCPVLGIPLTQLVGHGRQDYNPSVDRIIPQKGYTKGNIEIMSDKANRMKNNASPEELLTFSKEMLKRYAS
jgi:hypothetical protein